MGDFVTPEEVTGYAQSDLDRYTVELLIKGTEAAARRTLGWNVTEETVTDQPVVPQGRYIFLPTVHLTAVANVTESGTVSTPGTAFGWTQGGVLTRGSGCWSTLFGAVTATFTHGYPPGDPALDDLKDMIGSAVARRIGNPEVLSSYTVGGVSETYATGPQLPSVALTRIEKDEMLGAYGIPVLA